jgi:hypothetical protein
MCKNVEGLNGKPGKVVDWAVTIARIATPLILTGVAFLWWNLEGRVDEAERDIAVMQGNLFTKEDGLEVWKQIGQFAAIREDIAEIKRELERMRDRRE